MRYRGDRGGSRRGRVLIVLALVLVLAVGLWLGLRVGPEPAAALETSYPAIGRSTDVTAVFQAPTGGLGPVRLELEQGDRTEVLAEAEPASARLGLTAGDGAGRVELAATVGRDHQTWLEEGEAVLRAVALRRAGPLRGAEPVVREQTMAVRLRPPALEVVSRQHYVRQGGSGVVVLRPGPGAARVGVQVDGVEAPAWPMPGGGDDVFVLFPVPWDVESAAGLHAFAEDDAGNRTTRAFVDLFKPQPPGSDTIQLSRGFLERVVPEIARQTELVDPGAPLVEQYVTINDRLRRENLDRIRELAERSAGDILWRGAFVALPGGARQASFADRREYVWEGEVVDRQTHLGLDLASVAAAPVPAANHGRVLFAGWLGIYGNAVVLDHGTGLLSLYGHLSSVEVAEGDRVTKGQTVARTGATGLAGGDHLHFEIFVAGESVSPLEWLDGHWIADNVASKIPLPEDGG